MQFIPSDGFTYLLSLNQDIHFKFVLTGGAFDSMRSCSARQTQNLFTIRAGAITMRFKFSDSAHTH